MKARYYYIYHLCILLVCSITCFSCSKENAELNNLGQEEKNGDMILSEETSILTADFINSVLEPVTGSQIILKSTVKENILPKVGDILLSLVPSDKFPYGFLGKVSDINKNEKGYVINTEKAYLDETFDKLYVEDEMIVFSYEPPVSNSRTTIDVNGINIKFEDYLQEDCKGKQFTLTIPVKGNSVKLSAGIALKFSYEIDIDKSKHEPIFNFTLKQAWNCNCLGNLGFEGSYDFSVPLGHLNFGIPGPVGGITHILFRPRVELHALTQVQGKMEFDFLKNNSSISSFSFNNIGGIPQMEPTVENEESSSIKCNKVALDGSIFAGLRCSFIAYALNEQVASIQIPFSIGPRLSADFAYDKINSTPYESLANLKITMESLHYSLEAKCSLFKFFNKKRTKNINGEKNIRDFHEYTISFGPYENCLGEKKEYGIFPSFSDIEAGRTKADRTKAIVSSIITNELIIPVEIDYNLYDENDSKITSEHEWISYYKKEDMNNPFVKTLDGLNITKTYFVRPAVNLPLFGEIEAEPSVEIESDVLVVTEGSISSDYSLSLLGSFDPSLQSSHNLSEYGICYNTVGNPSFSEIHVAAGKHDKGVFKITIPAQRNITYYYCAYIIADGNIYYGDVKEAKLEQNNLLVGHWKFLWAHSVGDYDDEDLAELGDLIINENGTFSMLFDGEYMAGEWSIGGGRLILRYDDDIDEITLAFSFEVTETNLKTYISTTEQEEEGHNSGIYVYYERM